MGKRSVYTTITPLPAHVPRQLALDMLHSHTEMIQLNPLVTGVKSIEAPRDAASDEFFSQWYEISEVITWGLGMKKKISFKGVFHDQLWGMQSHVYAPMGVDLRNKYRIGGSQPGEPREMRELGVNTPVDGLYLREDVEIACAVPLTMSFVKKETKAATSIMISRLTRKAELLDDGTLHAMFENGRLKTTKPSQQATFAGVTAPSPSSLASSSPPLESYEIKSDSAYSPTSDQKGYGKYSDVVSRRASQSSQRRSYVPQYQQAGYNGPDDTRHGAESGGMPEIAEMPGDFYQQNIVPPGLYPPPLKSSGQVFRAELPGDSSLAPPKPSAEIRPAQTYQAYTQPSPQPSPGHQNRLSFQHPSPQPSHQQPSPLPSPGLPNRQSYQPPVPYRSPALPDRQSSNSSSKYRISNPDVPPILPAHRHSSGAQNSSQQVDEWQRGLGIATFDDPNSIRHSTISSQEQYKPDHNRFSQISMQQTPTHHLPYDPAGKGVGKVSKCPVCGLFEGDEAAVSHHVSKAHFA